MNVCSRSKVTKEIVQPLAMIGTAVCLLNRSETGLQAVCRSVTARTGIDRIPNERVVATTNYVSALKDAQARSADSKAQLFDAKMQRVVAQAELVGTEGRQ